MMKRLMLLLVLLLAAPLAAQDGICTNDTWLKAEQPTGMVCVGGANDGNACDKSFDCPNGVCGEVASYAQIDANFENVRDACTSSLQSWPDDGTGLSLALTDAGTTSGWFYSINMLSTIDPPSSSAGRQRVSVHGYTLSQTGNTQELGSLIGVYGSAEHYGTGPVSTLSGTIGWAYNVDAATVQTISAQQALAESDGGAVTRMQGTYSELYSYGGTVENQSNYFAGLNEISGSTVTNRYAFWVEGPFTGTPTGRDFSIYSEPDVPSYFAGGVLSGTNSKDLAATDSALYFYPTEAFDATREVVAESVTNKYVIASSDTMVSGTVADSMTLIGSKGTVHIPSGTIGGANYATAMWAQLVVDADVTDWNYYSGIDVNATQNGTGTGNLMYGANVQVTNYASANALYGVQGYTYNEGTTIDAVGLRSWVDNYGTATNLYGVLVFRPSNFVATNRYAIKLVANAFNETAPTGEDYAIHSELSQPSYFAGSVEIQDVLKLIPQANAPVCGAGEEGTLYHDSSAGKALCWCDGTSWNVISGSGACA